MIILLLIVLLIILKKFIGDIYGINFVFAKLIIVTLNIRSYILNKYINEGNIYFKMKIHDL